jgi:four helix bundle protein
VAEVYCTGSRNLPFDYSVPRSEIFGLVSQSRRAAVGVPANIAEGYSRRNRAEYSRFINIAFASAAELETHLIIAKELKLAPLMEFKHSEHLLLEVLRMLRTLEEKLRSK